MTKQKKEEKLQQQECAELSFFNKLGHVEKVEILKGIEEMKDELRAVLETTDSSKQLLLLMSPRFFMMLRISVAVYIEFLLSWRFEDLLVKTFKLFRVYWHCLMF
ncbi:putative E3 ubiquitin-protein ligase UBR7 [Spatholobus suberectus]|nr:putative E3 ubiquitin-protein ligase UBR7 [Spatholobus suberectus]